MNEAIPSSTASASTAVAKRRSLFDIVQHIGMLDDSRESVPESVLLEFQAEVATVALEAGDKVDAYCGLIVFLSKRAAEAKASLQVTHDSEIIRNKKRADRAEAEIDRLTKMLISCAQLMPLNPKTGKPNPLKGIKYDIVFHKVADSCQVTDDAAVPAEYKSVTLVFNQPLTLAEWLEPCERCKGKVMTPGDIVGEQDVDFCETCDRTGYSLHHIHRDNFTRTVAVDKRALLATLKQPCGNCSGTGEILPAGPSDAPVTICPKCNGSKHRLIPGARLVTGKLRLVIE